MVTRKSNSYTPSEAQKRQAQKTLKSAKMRRQAALNVRERYAKPPTLPKPPWEK